MSFCNTESELAEWLERMTGRLPRSDRVSTIGARASWCGFAAIEDPNSLGLLKHCHSLVPLAQETRKPIFLLRAADGAIGAHQQGVQGACGHFTDLASRIRKAVGLRPSSSRVA
jgi:hypothetical protein